MSTLNPLDLPEKEKERKNGQQRLKSQRVEVTTADRRERSTLSSLCLHDLVSEGVEGLVTPGTKAHWEETKRRKNVNNRVRPNTRRAQQPYLLVMDGDDDHLEALPRERQKRWDETKKKWE